MYPPIYLIIIREKEREKERERLFLHFNFKREYLYIHVLSMTINLCIENKSLLNKDEKFSVLFTQLMHFKELFLF